VPVLDWLGWCLVRRLSLLRIGSEHDVPVQRQDAKMAEPPTEHELVARQMADGAFIVHGTLGPGLPQSVNEQCLACEPDAGESAFQQQAALLVRYLDQQINAECRIDLVIGGLVVIEIKPAGRTLPTHETQPVANLKLSATNLDR